MTSAHDIVRSAQAEVCRPWLRHILTPAEWSALAHAAAGENWTLLGLWADTQQVHALYLDRENLTGVLASTPATDATYPALSPVFPVATLFECTIRDLWGHEAQGGRNLRPWLNHGNWPQARPMSTRPDPRARPEPPLLAGPEQDDTMLLPLGPIWGRLEEAAHLRLMLRGSTIVSAEALLGFTHKGSLALMRGKSPRTAARFAARLAGDATVAHSLAFAQAAEVALDCQPPPKAVALRVVMLELERIGVHLDSLAEVGRLIDAPPVWTHCGVLRERLLRACEAAFGHRLLMDCVVPGGVAGDIAASGRQALLQALGDIASALPELIRLHESPAVSTRLTGIGRVDAPVAEALGASGVVGRAAGVLFDTRSVFAREYAGLMPSIVATEGGDAQARQQVRLLDIDESLRLIGAALDAMPAGPLTVALPQDSGEGIACAESARGDVWHWVRLDHGQIATSFCRDPGWALWPLAERVLVGTHAADVDLVRASIGLVASGMDL